VRQRAGLAEKGENPHLLVMSATPIPRSLGFVLYGDLDISVIDELPPGRQPIDTFLVGRRCGRGFTPYQKTRRTRTAAYFVCPVIEKSDVEGRRDADSFARTLAGEVFGSFRVGLLHGRLKGDKKEEIMRGFAEGKIDILVSTP
jgi:ATP-dependent DNA helicase RecG